MVTRLLAWDFPTSGPVTNRTGRWCPRLSRVLLYLGYTLLPSAIVTYLSSSQGLVPSIR
jgi:hypothetical protein